MATNSDQINIFIIDDDVVDVMEIKNTFKQLVNEYPYADINFQVAIDGADALYKLYGKDSNKLLLRPDVIFLDIRMPKIDGIGFLRALRTDPSFDNIPLFLLTGSYGRDESVGVQGLQITGRLMKPLSQEDAEHIFKVILDTHIHRV